MYFAHQGDSSIEPRRDCNPTTRSNRADRRASSEAIRDLGGNIPVVLAPSRLVWTDARVRLALVNLSAAPTY